MIKVDEGELGNKHYTCSKIISKAESLGKIYSDIVDEKVSLNLKKNINNLLSDLNFNFNIVKSFVNIPVFQILAYIKTIKKNLNPDKPKNLDYTMII